VRVASLQSVRSHTQIPAATRKENPGIFNLLFGAYGFPVGLSMCVINGASLFTSNIAYMMAAFIERRSTGMQALWVVWLSYFSNLVGELLLLKGLWFCGLGVGRSVCSAAVGGRVWLRADASMCLFQ
jgi:formate/nitrite transporter FocA (FNT family)